MRKFLECSPWVGVLALLLLPYISYAQEVAFRRFSTQRVRAATIKAHPEYEVNLTVLENAISNYGSKGDDGQMLRVPIIFHFVDQQGENRPDQEQVQFQMDVLNKYFGQYNPEIKEFSHPDIKKYVSLGASVGIQFFMPSRSGEIAGVEIPAINRVPGQKKTWGTLNEVQDSKRGGFSAIAPDKVINVWVANLDSNLAGYAHLPGAPSELDGIVIDPDFFGNEKGNAKAPFIQGKTLVHLMGTYLGLSELWNESERCKDDFVQDTPIHYGPTSIAVSTEKDYRLVCPCPGTPTAMFMNFMDNTDDGQLFMFTEGQKRRMRAVLISDGLRKGLTQR